MNCKNMEQQLLLAQSGELDEEAIKAIEEHITACKPCQHLQADLNAITTVAQEALRTGTPSENTRAAIRLAGQNAINRKSHQIFPSWPMQIMAYAAALLIFVGGWAWLGTQTKFNRANELSAILTMVDDAETSEQNITGDGVNNQALQELAKQLLQMEGFFADDPEELTTANPTAGPPPTTFREHNTDGLPQKTCV